MLHAPIGPHYYLNFVKVFFLAVQKLPSPIQDAPQDVSEHYRIFKSFLFFSITNVCWGYCWQWSPRQLFMCLNSQALQLYFTYISSLCTCSGGTAVIEVKPLALTVPALILMEAHIIAHAIKEVQMLSGSAHIVISQCNTSLIFVVF